MKTKRILMYALLAASVLAATGVTAQTIPAIQLPFTPVTVSVQSYGATNSPGYYLATVTNVTSGFDITNGKYAAWCVMPNEPITNKILYPGTLCSSYETSSLSTTSYPIPTDLQSTGWGSVNYLINHRTNYYAQGAVQRQLLFLSNDNYQLT